MVERLKKLLRFHNPPCPAISLRTEHRADLQASQNMHAEGLARREVSASHSVNGTNHRSHHRHQYQRHHCHVRDAPSNQPWSSLCPMSLSSRSLSFHGHMLRQTGQGHLWWDWECLVGIGYQWRAKPIFLTFTLDFRFGIHLRKREWRQSCGKKQGCHDPGWLGWGHPGASRPSFRPGMALPPNSFSKECVSWGMGEGQQVWIGNLARLRLRHDWDDGAFSTSQERQEGSGRQRVP